MKRDKVTVLDHRDECPCGSGIPLEDCHQDPIDGKLRKYLPSLRPSGNRTGYSHPKCYLNGTHNCSRQLSREHYVSRSVLEVLGDSLLASGAFWQNEGDILAASLGNLTAKILCKRHNECLSGLDYEAGLFFRRLATASADLKRKTLSRKPTIHLVSGEALELWALKVACGHYFGVGAFKGQKLTTRCTMDLDKVHAAFFDKAWNPRCGMYFRAHPGYRFRSERKVHVGALVDEPCNKMCGVRIGLAGYEMELILDADHANPGPWDGLIRRPTEIVLTQGHRRHIIILTWPTGTQESSIKVNLVPGSFRIAA